MTETVFEKFSKKLTDLKIKDLRVDKETKKTYLAGESAETLVYEHNKKEQRIYLLKQDLDSLKFSPYTSIRVIVLDPDIDPSKYVYLKDTKISLSFSWNIKSILDISSKIHTLLIRNRYKTISKSDKLGTAKISLSQYNDVYLRAYRIEDKSKRYKSSFKRYLLNKEIENVSNRTIGNTTNISKGEIEMAIDRLNIKTKKSKKDYEKYLNEEDSNGLQQLFTSLLGVNYFSPDYMRRINNYFIRERLEDIIQLGRRILALKSTRLDTVEAKSILKELTGKEDSIKQFENVWQTYFNKYLLYLIFSYKSIFPKIKLTNVEGSKKFPDFIGVNHYNGVDVIEIKTHLAHAVEFDSGRKNFSFSTELSRAIIQTINYIDAIIRSDFANDTDKDNLIKKTNVENLNRPRGIIIISSLGHMTKGYDETQKNLLIRDFTKLRNSLHNIEILTFDEILNIAQDYLGNIVREVDTE